MKKAGLVLASACLAVSVSSTAVPAPAQADNLVTCAQNLRNDRMYDALDKNQNWYNIAFATGLGISSAFEAIFICQHWN